MRCLVILVALALLPTTATADDAERKPPPPETATWWAITVAGETDGKVWVHTWAPNSTGGAVPGTADWACKYGPIVPTSAPGTGRVWEDLRLACTLGDAEALIMSTCGYRTKPKTRTSRERLWKLGEPQTVSLGRKGQSASAASVTITIRCDVDTRYVLA